ncbi:lipopolysaccharide export system permease protein [Deinobacterium chartae]|uniref:Lipopolysaccharide export system permease protein n=1 Tax=Deinobacterium chartae TaxID=521158 RepID=A0A841I4T6_9DEIO|nr:LptF/LptG family permease [Deinobacterium chartae]MBB6099428.1 lipopolysaccharide export system permease protein [Deinobacterium chartae]
MSAVRTSFRSSPVGRRLDHYLVSEVLPLLVGGLLVVVVLFLLAALVEVLAPILAKGANPLLVAKLMAFKIPDAIGRGLPIALLFAVLLAMSRLSSDSEIKSALAGGVGPVRLMVPVMVLALGVSTVSFLNSELLVPRAESQVLQTQRDILLDNPRVLVEEGTVFKDALGRAIYIDQILPGNELRGVRIIQMGPGQPAREIMTAERGLIEPGSATIVLYEGQRVTYRDAKPVTAASFEEARLPVQDLQASLNGTSDEVQPVNLPLGELRARIAAYRSQSLPVYREETALNRKFAEPLAAVAFGFFGVTLALYTFRTGGGLGLVWVMMLTFVYYATWSVFRIMGEQGALPPVIAAWAPDALYLIAGGVLLLLSTRR